MTEKQNNGRFSPLKLIDEQVRGVIEQVENRGKKLERDVRTKEWYRRAKRMQKDLEKRARGVQKDFDKRTKGIQKDLEKRTKGIQKDLEKRTKGIQKDLEKRTKGLQKDLHKRRDSAYHLAGLATKAEVDALQRKLSKLGQAHLQA